MKSKAILIYSIKNDDNTMDYINLEDSNLHTIDKLTSKYASIDELKNIPKYKEQIEHFLNQKKKIDNGEIKLFYIENKEYKEELKILFNEKHSLNINKDITNEKITEFEKARKLLRECKLIFADQDAIYYNTTKKLLLPRKFNEQSKFNRKTTVLCHFCKRLVFRPYPHTENIKQWNIDKVHKVYKCHTFDKDLEEYKKIKENYYE